MKSTATLWLRLEGAAAFGLMLVLYRYYSLSWGWFAALFLIPDLAMLGYLAGPRIGAVAYNLAHTYALAVPVLAAGILTGVYPVVAAGAIWCAHIGFDRALGYGLKLPEGFRATHLGRIGREPRQ